MQEAINKISPEIAGLWFDYSVRLSDWRAHRLMCKLRTEHDTEFVRVSFQID
jgi:hypothetical protein